MTQEVTVSTPIETPNEEITPAAEKVEGQEPVVTDEEATPEVVEAEVVEEETPEEEIPADVLRKKVTDANAEAANYRTKLRAAEEALKTAKTPEEVAAIVADLTKERETTEHSLVVENVALLHKLPEDLATLLSENSTGKTREQIEAHAKTLAKYAPIEDEEVTPRGGLRPQSEEGAFDPVAAVAKNRRRR